MIKEFFSNPQEWQKPIIIKKDCEITLGEIKDKVMAIQALLTDFKKCNIAMLLNEGENYIASLFAVIMSGNTVFPINTQLTEQNISDLILKSNAKIIITSIKFVNVLRHILPLHKSLQVVYVEELQVDKSSLIPYCKIYKNSPIMLIATSGRTGTTKLAMITEKNLKTSTIGHINKLEFEAEELKNIKYLLTVPSYSSYGNMIIFICFILKLKIMFFSEKFVLEKAFEYIEKYKITNLEVSSTALQLWEQILHRKNPYNLMSLKDIGFSGSKISGDFIQKIEKTYPHIRIRQGYGMTEASGQITRQTRIRNINYYSVGSQIEGCTLAIKTEEGIYTTEPYIIGEIVCSGDNVMLGYYNDKKETKNIKHKEYLHTGDMGYIDDEGMLFICGRKKNLIISRGFKIFAEEIEECITKSQLVKKCVVYGKEDCLGNENVCADIVPVDDTIKAEQLRCYCSTRLASFKQPQEINFCENLDNTSTEKVKRKKE